MSKNRSWERQGRRETAWKKSRSNRRRKSIPKRVTNWDRFETEPKLFFYAEPRGQVCFKERGGRLELGSWRRTKYYIIYFGVIAARIGFRSKF